eukprot:529985-Pelagomonas_calceolata.AAC.2
MPPCWRASLVLVASEVQAQLNSGSCLWNCTQALMRVPGTACKLLGACLWYCLHVYAQEAAPGASINAPYPTKSAGALSGITYQQRNVLCAQINTEDHTEE